MPSDHDWRMTTRAEVSPVSREDAPVWTRPDGHERWIVETNAQRVMHCPQCGAFKRADYLLPREIWTIWVLPDCDLHVASLVILS